MVGFAGGDRQYTRPVLERLMLRTAARRRGVHQVLTENQRAVSPWRRGAFRFEALEPDHIPLEKTRQQQQPVQGIYFNEWRRPVKYLVCQSLPACSAGGSRRCA